MGRKLDFKISSGLKNIIGKELITDDHIAIFELVKNSYDAKAKSVKIIFKHTKILSKDNSRIIIVDDGDGMSYKDIENKWLFVGYSSKKSFLGKIQNYRDKIKTRIVAGYKGIGRFSADRLGQKMNLYTKKKNEKQIHCLDVDWKKFEVNQKEEFHSIDVFYSERKTIPEHIPVDSFKQGTIIEITNLSENWDKTKILKLKKYLQRLLNPSATNLHSDFQIELIADEFHDEDKKNAKKKPYEIINGVVKNIVFEELGIKTTRINCEVTKKHITIEVIDKDKFVFRFKEKNSFDKLADVKIHIFYLNTEAKKAFTKKMGLQPKKFGSIFLYRNGFRIHPYGDEGDDWLGLEIRKGQGFRRFLATREIMGRIEVYGPQRGLIEVSSRSGGIVKTEELEQLKVLFIKKVLERLEKYVVEGIDWDKAKGVVKGPDEIKADSIVLIEEIVGKVEDPTKRIEFNPELLDIFKEREIENIPELIKNVEVLTKHVKSDKEVKYINNIIKGLKHSMQRLSTKVRKAEQTLAVQKKENLFLQKSLSMDDIIAQNLAHTIEISSDTIKGDIEDIMEEISKDANIETIKQILEKISLENEKIISLAGLVTNANFNLMYETISDDLALYITQYIQRVLVEIQEGIRYSISNRNIVHNTTFSPLEISVMIDNFLSNSQKADAFQMFIKFEKHNEFLRILIGDDGEGIPKDVEEFIFTRGFTTTDGAGIGMSHIKSITNKMGGKVKFLGNNIKEMGKGACFEVLLHEARE